MRFFKFTIGTDERLEKYVGRRPGFRRDIDEGNDDCYWGFDYDKTIKDTNESLLEKSYGLDYFVNFSYIGKKRTFVAFATERISETAGEINAHLQKYLQAQKFDGPIKRMDEITLDTYRRLLKDAQRNDFIDNDIDFDSDGANYGLPEDLFRRRHSCSLFEEYLLEDKQITLKDTLRKKSILATAPELKTELERIFRTPRERWIPGNPVHYVMPGDDGSDRKEYTRLLMEALYSCKRVASKRFIIMDYEKICDNYNSRVMSEIFKLQTGGIVIVRVRKETINDGAYLTGHESRADQICKLVMEWKNKVLTIFQFPRDSEKMQDAFFSEIDGVSFIKIKETILFDNDAKDFLSSLARETGLKSHRGLRPLVVKTTGYTKNDLRKLFDLWHTDYLRENIFPQYAKDSEMIRQEKKGPVGSGIEKLNSLIGLAETKELISNILDFAKAQTLYPSDKKRPKQSLHMIFSGNPGTAKTTVARLVAQILKENRILEEGELLEVGRADLVGKYVGWTAPTVKNIFKEASGSVLFIDEAYSLVDDRDGLYGDEAITTIVQEMENHRDDVVVIFAGYTDKMEGFLQKNPGLRSRIGFHVNFPDYSAAELFKIMELLAKDYGMKLAADVKEHVAPMIEKASGIPEFGNGRYVRNLLEKARMRQATRLIHMDQKKVTEQTIATLIADDFEEIQLSAVIKEKRVGFI